MRSDKSWATAPPLSAPALPAGSLQSAPSWKPLTTAMLATTRPWSEQTYPNHRTLNGISCKKKEPPTVIWRSCKQNVSEHTQRTARTHMVPALSAPAPPSCSLRSAPSALEASQASPPAARRHPNKTNRRTPRRHQHTRAYIPALAAPALPCCSALPPPPRAKAGGKLSLPSPDINQIPICSHE